MVMDRPHRDARRLHVDQQEGDALLLLGRRVGAHEAEDPVGVLRQGRPGLLAVDDVVVAVALRAWSCSEARSEPAPGSEKPWHHQSSRLAMRGRKRFFCVLVAERDDHRPDHVDAEGQGLRAPGPCCISSWKMYCWTGRPAGAAPLDRPIRHGPALRVQDALPGDDVVLARVTPLEHLARMGSGSAVRKNARTSSRKASSSSVKRRSMVERPQIIVEAARRVMRRDLRFATSKGRKPGARLPATPPATACRPEFGEGSLGIRGRRASRADRSCRPGTPAARRA